MCLYILGGWSYVVLVAVWGGFVAVLGGLGVWGGLGRFNGQHSREAPSQVKAATCNILRHYLKSYIDLMYGVHAPMYTLNIIKIHILDSVGVFLNNSKIVYAQALRRCRIKSCFAIKRHNPRHC